ncbi:MAG: helix-turn-helix domain-containing protein [Candidatus Kerfeldbacteria bacterium]|nr:helix-turn-helix domain-containing protein [Candidatus Kerfeldbacteria bacterium]
MAKFSPHNRLSQREEQDVLMDFFQSLGTLRGFTEAAQVFQDLLSRAELTMLAKRLKIAKSLLKGMKYQEIARDLKVSTQTIARVNLWLEEAGEGFRMMFERTKEKSIKTNSSIDELWSKMRRRYPLHHWPELLIREVFASANRKQKDRLYTVLRNLQFKGKLSRDLEAILRGKQN